MKQTYLPLVVGSLVAIVSMTGVLLMSNTKGKADGVCYSDEGKVLQVTIIESKVSPATTKGRLCDKIRITNYDAASREMAFGVHQDHVPYDGIGERVLNKGQSFTITLNKTGTYHFHDHLHDEVEGYFIVR